MAVKLKHPHHRGDLIAVLTVIFIRVMLAESAKFVQTKPETISVVINKDSLKNPDMIQVLNAPAVISEHVIVTVDYRCSKERIAGVEIVATTSKKKLKKIYRKIWKCSGGTESSVQQKNLIIKLPSKYVYAPDRYNPSVVTLSDATVRAWLLDSHEWRRLSRFDPYSRAFVKVSYYTKFLSPYSRPRNTRLCLTWAGEFFSVLDTSRIGFCPQENETVEVVSYPAALPGSFHGIYRRMLPYTNADLEFQRQHDLPQFTLSIWVYILDYCPTGALCSIVHQFTRNDRFVSPVICLNKRGKIHGQMTLQSGEASAVLTPFILPRDQWIHIVFTFRKTRWTLDVEYGKNRNQTLSTYYDLPDAVQYNDTEDVFAFGGSELMGSFKGYIGQATFYRNKAYHASELPRPSPYHPMFELDISAREDRCQVYMAKIHSKIYQFNLLKQHLHQSATCPSVLSELLCCKNEVSDDVCPVWESPKSKQLSLVNRLLKRRILNGLTVNTKDIGKAIYDKMVSKIDKDLGNIPSVMRPLKQAACYESYDAMYMLSVILNNGFNVKANEIQSHAFLLLAALESHRLSLMSLANKHNLGLDGIPVDKPQAYLYYKYVADKAREDRDKHKDTDIVTESVRLTDEVEMREQTDEDGDIFIWMKHQAQQGVLGAQQYVARSLFWGSRGLQRNVQAALEYFRLGAEQQDPVAMYDYGIVLMRGQGTEKNVSKGLELMEQSANKGNANALGTLGWHALEVEKNYTKAAELLHRAQKKGNTDSAYNLGHMYLIGVYPNHTVDRDKAFWYIQWAALRSQFDAGVMLSRFLMRGTDKINPDLRKAVEWARFMSEKNPHLGRVLRKALKSYRAGDVALSIFYYLMAADSGSEVANFNLALLCEENKEGLVSSLEKECQWHRFNISTQREEHHIDSYALIKMGDFHWYGCEGNKDIDKALEFYTRAARKNDPHAIFNLAFMVEEGVNLPPTLLRQIGINPLHAKDNVTLLTELYSRCKDSKNTEAYLPCSLALWRIQVVDFWSRYHVWMGLSSVMGAAIVTTATLYSIYKYVRGFYQLATGQRPQDTV